MENRLPRSGRGLMTKAGEMAVGAAQYGPTIPLAIITAATLNEQVSALNEAGGAIGNALKELNDRHAIVRTKVRESRGYLTLVRDTCKPRLGSEFNQDWRGFGLVSSLVIPRTEAEVVSLLRAVKTFLANNSSFQCTVDTTEITAASTEARLTQLEAARANVNLQEKLIHDLVADRNSKVDVLRKGMRSMIAELRVRLGPLDSRWLAFGLNMPGAQSTPEVPSNVVVVLVSATAASVKWTAAARSDYYRVWLRIGGESQPWTALGSPADLDFTIEQLQGGSSMEVAISAVNSGGESAKSPPVTVVVPT